MTSRRQKYLFYHFCLGSVCLYIFFENFFMYARLMPIQRKVHFKNLQFLAVTYDMEVLICAFGFYLKGSVFFLCLSNF